LKPGVVAALAAVLAVGLVLALATGAVRLPPGRILELLAGAPAEPREAAVLFGIRLPRAMLAIAVGAALGLAGAAQQGLFRNPLADPALVGVSAGAALGAVGAIVLGHLAPGAVQAFLVPVAAFAGGIAATVLALHLARASGGAGTGGLLLAGIAVNAVCAAGTGLFVTISDDRQLRDITFWTMGSLAAGGWNGGMLALLASLVAALILLPRARALDALLLGEREAAALGVDVAALRRAVVTATALAVGAAVAAVGIIGFVGLVVPHLLRLAGTVRHGHLLPGAAIAGAGLLLLADAAARSLASPAEFPIGLVTSAIGGPFFIVLLLRRRAGA
jgi:iron complex transport system permease protein